MRSEVKDRPDAIALSTPIQGAVRFEETSFNTVRMSVLKHFLSKFCRVSMWRW
jgi:hypothetical protein